MLLLKGNIGNMDIILSLGIILTLGYFFGLIAEKFNFPRVTAYLIAGVLFSKSLLGHLIHLETETWSNIFSQICLGFIAYIVGGEINLKNLIKNSKLIIITTFFESITPVIFVFSFIYGLCLFFELPTIIAIGLASIASTTAPATTVAIIEQYQIKNEMKDTTLGIVTLDDAFGIILFIIITGFFFPSGETNSFIIATLEIFKAIGCGLFFGFLLNKFAKFSISNDFILPLLVGIVLIIVSLSNSYNFSSLLSLIVVGLLANNLKIENDKRISLLLPIQHIEEFIFITFFTLAGSHFSPESFNSALPLICIYVLARGIGKYSGAFLGVKLYSPSNKHLSKYLGLTLLPQAGVAIGLMFELSQNQSFSVVKPLLLNTVIGSTIVYEFFGPILAKYAFQKFEKQIN